MYGQVLIQPEFVSRDNKRVKARQIWGDLIYTPDSDIVAVLMHLGYYAHNLVHPPNIVVEVRAQHAALMPAGVAHRAHRRHSWLFLCCATGAGAHSLDGRSAMVSVTGALP